MLLPRSARDRAGGHLGLVLGHDFAQHSGRREAGGTGQVDGGLGVAGPLEHPARAVAEREDVPGPVQVIGPCRGVDEGGDGRGAVGCRDPGGRPVAVVDAHREGGALRLRVRGHHQGQVEQVGPLTGSRGTQITPEVWARKKAMFSGVAASAAMTRSPSFSRSSSSTTTASLRRPMASIASCTVREPHQAATSTRRSSPRRSHRDQPALPHVPNCASPVAGKERTRVVAPEEHRRQVQDVPVDQSRGDGNRAPRWVRPRRAPGSTPRSSELGPRPRPRSPDKLEDRLRPGAGSRGRAQARPAVAARLDANRRRDRTVNSGSSARTVPAPTSTASELARSRCTSTACGLTGDPAARAVGRCRPCVEARRHLGEPPRAGRSLRCLR